MTYLATIEVHSALSREVEIEAGSIQQAYQAAKELCRGDEFVRGVLPITSLARNDEPSALRRAFA